MRAAGRGVLGVVVRLLKRGVKEVLFVNKPFRGGSGCSPGD